LFELSNEKLKELGAIITTKEILGQPELWRQTYEYYLAKKSEIETFLNNVKYKKTRVIFTGAGTSQYVGDVCKRSLQKSGDVSRFIFESIATTDIVSSPQTTLDKDAPTILASFSRSGNSPESLAAVNLADQIVTNSYHIIATCAKDGELAQKTKGRDNVLTLLLPDMANDQGFAMTGSCSSMILLATLIFSAMSDEKKAEQVTAAIQATKNLFGREAEIAASLPKDAERAVYVGSGPTAALTREAQLKILELTAGKIATLFDSSMGFRHGPKSFINKKTAVYAFCANDPYTRLYDLDLYHELKEDNVAQKITLIGQNLGEPGFELVSGAELEEEFIVLPFLAFAQIVSLNASIAVGNTPDTPSATGTVNRVVKGVLIHKYNREII
jgi:tagatose-6-phosphate ketose/aldose isomerase